MIRPGQGLILITVALLCLGVVMVNSAAVSVGGESRLALQHVLGGRPALFAILALTMLFLGSMMPVNRIRDLRGVAAPLPWIVAGAILLLLLVHVPGIGREVNGARRWVDLGPIGFQPSELAKWGLPVGLARYVARQAKHMSRMDVGLVIPLGAAGVICALIATEDLGTAVLIAAVSGLMLIAGGARVWHALLTLPVAAAGVAVALIQSPYRMERVRAFLDPYQDPQGVGYHMIQSMAAVSGGGLAGRGLGNSVQKFGYLPEDTTDFIFAIISEELGVAGAAAVVALYGLLLLLGLSIVWRATDPFLRLLGLGIILTIGLQAVINLAVVTGCGPTKGIALPLISSGGTGWVLTAFSIGLLIAISQASREVRSGTPPSGPDEAMLASAHA